MATAIETPSAESKAETEIKARNVRDNSFGLAGYLTDIATQKSSEENVAEPEVEPEAKVEPQESVTAPKTEPVKTEASTKTDKVKVEVSVEESRKLLKERDRVITRLGQTNADLKTEIAAMKASLDVVNQKLDGTYDAKTAAQPKPVDLETVRMKAVIDTSAKIAAKRHKDEGGMEYVTAQVFAPDAPFRAFDGDKAIQARVFGSDSPVEEALLVLEEREIVEKYGSGDLKTIIEGLKRDLTEQIKAELKGTKPAADTRPVPKRIVGVGPDAAGENNLPRQETSNVPADINFNSVFPHLKNAPFGGR